MDIENNIFKRNVVQFNNEKSQGNKKGIALTKYVVYHEVMNE